MFSCGTLTQEKAISPPVSFENKTLKVESSSGCEEEQACARYIVNFPEFSGLDTMITDQLQREMSVLLSMGDPEPQPKTFQKAGEEFVKDYLDFTKEMPESNLGWYYYGNVNVNVLTDTLLSLSVEEEYFTGGAHGSMGTYFININPKTGSKITLSSVLKDGYIDSLTEIGEQAFKSERELSDTTSYQYNSFEFPNNQFQLNSNYGFMPEGIVFYFNSYEIAPYAVGPTEVLIPYDKIKDWLK